MVPGVVGRLARGGDGLAGAVAFGVVGVGMRAVGQQAVLGVGHCVRRAGGHSVDDPPQQLILVAIRLILFTNEVQQNNPVQDRLSHRNKDSFTAVECNVDADHFVVRENTLEPICKRTFMLKS